MKKQIKLEKKPIKVESVKTKKEDMEPRHRMTVIHVGLFNGGR